MEYGSSQFVLSLMNFYLNYVYDVKIGFQFETFQLLRDLQQMRRFRIVLFEFLIILDLLSIFVLKRIQTKPLEYFDTFAIIKKINIKLTSTHTLVSSV